MNRCTGILVGVDVNNSIINTIVDVDSITTDSQDDLVFSFYVQVMAANGSVYIINDENLLAAAQVSSDIFISLLINALTLYQP